MELSSPASKIPLVGSNYARKLEKLGIFTIEDFLHHIPARYKDLRIISDILNVQAGETITIRGTVKSMKNIYTKYGKKLQVAEIADTTGVISAVWFNQTYLVKSIKAGEMYSFSGKVETFNNKLALMSPDYESYKNGDAGIHTGRLVPVYPETAGVSSKWLRSRVNHAYNLLENDLEEFLPDKIISEYNLLGFSEAIREIHFPDKPERVEPARRRLAFNELLFHQLKSLYRKGQWNKNQTSHKLKIERV